jgi:hypothetical protein
VDGSADLGGGCHRLIAQSALRGRAGCAPILEGRQVLQVTDVYLRTLDPRRYREQMAVGEHGPGRKGAGGLISSYTSRR